MTRLVGQLMLVGCLIGICVVPSASPSPAAPQPANLRLSTILSRAAAYTTTFAEQFLTVVAEERYEQKVGRLRRILRSDALWYNKIRNHRSLKKWRPFVAPKPSDADRVAHAIERMG